MRLLIVGGSDAGISAGLRARELDSSAEVILLLADGFPNYSICGLPFYISGETPDWHDLAHQSSTTSKRRDCGYSSNIGPSPSSRWRRSCGASVPLTGSCASAATGW